MITYWQAWAEAVFDDYILASLDRGWNIENKVKNGCNFSYFRYNVKVTDNP